MIAIPNMEKPKSCYNHCEFIAMKEIGCPLKDYIESHQYKDRIHPTCPLIEIDLVRCGECKHYKREECRLDPFWERYTEPNDFCSQGERRADEGTTE